MWFLQVDTLLIMLGMSLGLGILASLAKTEGPGLRRLCLIADIALLWYVSKRLAVFALAYTLVSYAFIRILAGIKKHRKFWFYAFCIAFIVPLLYSRLYAKFGLPTFGISFVGLAFAMLRAIDGLYYVYFGESLPEFEIYLNYMLFFPVITAGPVFRFRDFRRTWNKPSRLNIETLTEAVFRIIRGLFKKLVVSMLLSKVLAALVRKLGSFVISLAIPPVALFVLYFDMAGYADIAIAMGSIMGFKVPENFKKPFSAPSLTQEWRNWHVSVSDWIREHVYVLVSGKELTRWHNAGLAIIVMMFMALWQSFSKAFVVYGILMGLLLALENLLNITSLSKGKTNKIYYWFRVLVTLYIFACCCCVVTLTGAELRALVSGYFSIFKGGIL